jgi:hypothetical protein
VVGPNCASLAWRGDGQWFAVTAWEVGETGDSPLRKLRVYERKSLKPHAEGRNEDGSVVMGMGSAVGWATDGSIIAASQTYKNKTQVSRQLSIAHLGHAGKKLKRGLCCLR